MPWHHIRVTYYERDKDALLLEAVRPLFRRISGDVAAVSFTRHWRRGPHVRLAVRTDAGTFDRLVRPETARMVGGFLVLRPSRRRVDPDRDQPAHQRLAVLENVSGPIWPWHPDNSIQPDGDAPDQLADFSAETTDLAFQIIAGTRGPARLAAGFHLLVTTGCAVPGLDLARTFLAFRSHAETFLGAFPEGAALRAAWERRYRDNAPALARRVMAVRDALTGDTGAVPFVAAWRAALRAHLPHAEGLAMPDVPQAEPGDDWRASPFHQRLFAHPGWPRTQRSAEFRRYRWLLNLTYPGLTRLGIDPTERFLTCYLVSRAVEDCYGISIDDLIG
jgi:hypothetical protein